MQDRSYKGLNPRTRILFGVGLMINAGLALQFSDQIETALGLTPTPQDEQKLQDTIPRISPIERNAR